MQTDGAAKARKRKQRVDVACEFCRKRKLGCNNAKPKCGNCAVYERECTYTAHRDRNASMTLLRRHGRERAANETSRIAMQGSHLEASGSELGAGASIETSITHRHVVPTGEINHSISSRGTLFHGPTSAMFEETRKHPKTSDQVSSSGSTASDVLKKSQLMAETARQRQLEAINFRSKRLDFGQVDPNLGMKLLSIFWKRQTYTGTIVYRPYFMRDMACQGPYFSELLLNAIFLVSTKLDPESQKPLSLPEIVKSGQSFQDTINRLIHGEHGRILFSSSIPTIQALLLLSDNLFAAYDQRSLSWQYLGIAINMITDLHIHIDRSSSPSGEPFLPEDIETRRRVFWTAFVLDKVQALYQGRSPRLRDIDTNVPLKFLDDFDELEAYYPFGFTRTDDLHGDTSHCVTTFEQFCKLSVIIDHILGGLYTAKAFQKDSQKLWQTSWDIYLELMHWRDSLPTHLSIQFDAVGNVDTTGGYTALPHTLCLSLMFFSMLILLHRPFLCGGHLSTPCKSALDHALHTCRTSAQRMDAILRLYRERWSINAPPYFLSYATYVSATIHVRLAARQPSGSSAHESLQNCLDILCSHQGMCLAPQKCINILTNLMKLLKVSVGNFPDGYTLQQSRDDSLMVYSNSELHAGDETPKLQDLSQTRGADETLDPTMSGELQGGMISGSIDSYQSLQPDLDWNSFNCDPEDWLSGVSFDFDPIFGFDIDSIL